MYDSYSRMPSIYGYDHAFHTASDGRSFFSRDEMRRYEQEMYKSSMEQSKALRYRLEQEEQNKLKKKLLLLL